MICQRQDNSCCHNIWEAVCFFSIKNCTTFWQCCKRFWWQGKDKCSEEDIYFINYYWMCGWGGNKKILFQQLQSIQLKIAFQLVTKCQYQNKVNWLQLLNMQRQSKQSKRHKHNSNLVLFWNQMRNLVRIQNQTQFWMMQNHFFQILFKVKK